MITYISSYHPNVDWKNNEVNENGPLYDLCQNYINKEVNLILLSNMEEVEEDMPFLKISSRLLKEFKNINIERVALGIKDVIDFNEAYSKISSLLERYKYHELYFFISPAFPSIKTAMVLCHLTRNLNSKIIQIRKAEFTDSGSSELVEFRLKKDAFSATAVIREYSQLNHPTVEKDYFISDAIKPLYEIANRIASTDDVTTLIIGESGTGKEHLARYIHDKSDRKNKPYAAINCSEFSDDLLRSELFGHLKGAFTGAIGKKDGIILANNGGTIFLDEIGDISPYMQQALLRVLQTREVKPVGSTKSFKFKVRFIAATNVDLLKKCEEGKFRWDLYYRLAVVDIYLPTLYQRGAKEVLSYIDFFLGQAARKFRMNPKKLSKETKQILLSYTFPGNIRELQNMVERFYVLTPDNVIEKKSIPPRVLFNNNSPLLLENVVKHHCKKVLNLNNGNKQKSARDLGISLNNLKGKLLD